MAKRANKSRLIEHCRKLPGATEDIKWADHLVFSVAAKMFAIFDVEDDSRAVRFKFDEDDFDRLCEYEGIAPASHVGRYGWVSFEDVDNHDFAELKDLLTKSHRLIVGKLSKKKQNDIWKQNGLRNDCVSRENEL